MKSKLKMAFDNEMALAKVAYKNADYDVSFKHLEFAHILGQEYVIPHTMSHWWMLKVGWQRCDAREVIGQAFRIIASVIFSRIWVPKGNTGGADVNPLKPMAIPDELKQYLNE